MEVVKKSSILIILVGISLFAGCKRKQPNNITELNFSNSNNSIIYKLIIDEKGKLIRKDSTVLNISLDCNYDYSFQELTENEFFTDCGAYNLKNSQLIKFEDLFPLRHSKEHVVFYDIKKKGVTIFDANNAKLTVKEGILNLDFQIFNNKPSFENLSPDYRYLVVLKPKNEISESHMPFDFYLKNLNENSESEIVNSVFGSKISDESNAKSIPKIIWINNTQFLFSNHSLKKNSSSCSIQKYDIETNKISIVGKIENLPESFVNYYFIHDEMGEVFYLDGIRMFSIDYLKNKIKANADYSLGNDFFVSSQKSGLSLKFKDEIIGDIPRESNFRFDKQFYRTEPNTIILKYKQQIENVNVEWKEICKIWRSSNGWTNVTLKNEVHLLSFKTD